MRDLWDGINVWRLWNWDDRIVYNLDIFDVASTIRITSVQISQNLQMSKMINSIRRLDYSWSKIYLSNSLSNTLFQSSFLHMTHEKPNLTKPPNMSFSRTFNCLTIRKLFVYVVCVLCVCIYKLMHTYIIIRPLVQLFSCSLASFCGHIGFNFEICTDDFFVLCVGI